MIQIQNVNLLGSKYIKFLGIQNVNLLGAKYISWKSKCRIFRILVYRNLEDTKYVEACASAYPNQ